MAKIHSILVVSIFAGFLSIANGGDSTQPARIDLPEGVVFRPMLYGHFEAGQIMSGNLPYDAVQYISTQGHYAISKVWTEDAVIQVGLQAMYRDHLKLVADLGTSLYFSYPYIPASSYTKNSRQDVFIDEVSATYTLGSSKGLGLSGQVGYFPYKYNPDGRNFGDYLFRTGTYPCYFSMGFDFPEARLLGMKVTGNVSDAARLDLILASSTFFPALDWSFAAIADVNVGKIVDPKLSNLVDIGAGIDWSDLIDVFSPNSFNVLGGDPTSFHSNNGGNYQYLTANGDSAWYTFQGLKVMGRISIDPKVLMSKEVSSLFGVNDLKLYSELDVVGWKNYPDSGISASGANVWIAPSYNKRNERMPVTFGFNFPTYKALDVLNSEFEWFGAHYYNDPSQLINMGWAPLPYNPQNWLDPTFPKKSMWKWSVYTKKSFCNGHFAIIAQAARDHMTLSDADYSHNMYGELLVAKSDWAWFLKASWAL